MSEAVLFSHFRYAGVGVAIRLLVNGRGRYWRLRLLVDGRHGNWRRLLLLDGQRGVFFF